MHLRKTCYAFRRNAMQVCQEVSVSKVKAKHHDKQKHEFSMTPKGSQMAARSDHTLFINFLTNDAYVSQEVGAAVKLQGGWPLENLMR